MVLKATFLNSTTDMAKNVLEENLNTVREQILDEQKLVTYVSLSRELCLHVNDCKYLLNQVVKDIKEKQPSINLNVNYIISGLRDNNNARTVVCTEGEIAKLKQEFKITFFEHVYSVIKGPPAVDNVAFLALNKFEDLPLCTGLVKNESCTKRSSEEIGHLKSHSQDLVNAEIPKKHEENKQTNKNSVEDKKFDPKVEVKSEPIIKTEITSPNKDIPNKPRKTPDSKRNGKTQIGIAGFFNKPPNGNASKKDSKNDIVKKENSSVRSQVKIEKMDVDEVDREKENLDKQQSSKSESKQKQTEESENNSVKEKKKKSLNELKKNVKLDKKRKRVLQVSDSESDDEKDDPFGDVDPVVGQESEDEIPPTPSVHTVKITSGIVNPRKRRKIVDKLYTDSEGFILTKKEEVYESCSENEEEASIKENVQATQVNKFKVEVSVKDKKTAPKTTKKKNSPPQKGKQSTLTSFFKKK